MSAELEEQRTVLQPEDTSAEPSGKPKRSYTIEFLLSLSELEVCKKLPSGFDGSLLSEFEDSYSGIQDRQRAPGSSPLQGFRRTDFGSSPSARGDSVGFSRGLNRWDSRSSGRSDTDSDSESGRHYGNQSRRSGQNSEHDGLLGSGSFPRPAGYAAGASVPRFRPNGNFNLSRTNEPYHPPRPYKAVPHGRREANDSFNDETFGSTDSTSEDRAEEEKKRRAEFELMRKEQQKVLQEKQKSSSGKPDDPFLEIVGLLDNSNDSKTSSDSDKILKQVPRNDSGRLPIPPQAPAARPLVPPGFVNSAVDKSSTSKPLVHADSSEVGKSSTANSHRDTMNITHVSVSKEVHCEATSLSAFKPEKLLDLSSAIQTFDTVNGSSLPDVSEVLENGEILALDSEVSGHKLLGVPGRSTSILEKLFGNTLAASSESASEFVESHDAKSDDIWSPDTLQSKFARWFSEDDKKSQGDISLERPSDLLSLIASGEKGGPDLTTGPILAPDAMLGHVTAESAHLGSETTVQFSNSNSPKLKPAVLTCEDLEQSILSEVGGNSLNSQSSVEAPSALDGKVTAPVDNRASQHLLSLLQKGISSKNAESMSNMEEVFFNKGRDHQVGNTKNVVDDRTSNGEADGLNSSGKQLTLESLFGTAFMNELHSAQNNSGSARVDASEPPGLPFPVNDIGSDGLVKLDESVQLSGFHDSRKILESSKPPADIEARFSGIEGGNVGHPGEDSLIGSLGGSINAQNSVLPPDMATHNKNFLSSSSSNPNVLEKLAVLGAALKDERSMKGRGQDPSFLHGPYDLGKPELPFQNLNPQAASPQLLPAQMNPGRRLFHALDSHPAHLDPHLKFLPPDAPLHNQLPTNMGPHPSGPPHHTGGLPGFDQLPPPMLRQMQMAGSLTPPQLLRGFPSGALMPPHPGHGPAGYMPEHNPMQGFPFGQRQPQFGGPGMAPPGADMGGPNNPPEAFQRLLERELRANPKPMQPFAAGGHGQPMYGHELDMGFQYR